MPVPASPDARNGPFVFGLIRAPASRSIGCDISAIVGYARALVSRTDWWFGFATMPGSSSASNTSTMFFGGRTYFGGSDAVGTCAMSAGANNNEAMTMRRVGRMACMGRSFGKVRHCTTHQTYWTSVHFFGCGGAALDSWWNAARHV